MAIDEAIYNETAELARNIDMIDYNQFDLFDLSYNLLLSPSGNDDGSQNGLPAEYACPNNDLEWDIYLWEDIKEKIQRPLLFHEVIEIYNKRIAHMDEIPAHNAAMEAEKRFCSEFLTKQELEDYLVFKKEYGCNGFEPMPDKQENIKK